MQPSSHRHHRSEARRADRKVSPSQSPCGRFSLYATRTFHRQFPGGTSARPVDDSFSAGQKDDEDITKRTIKAHRHRMMEKMQLQTLPELVSLAERVGVLGAVSTT